MDVNGLGDPSNDRAVVNGVQTTLDQFRGTPYVQVDLRVTRPFKVKERWQIMPFIEFFNLFNRNNPGANYVTDISALPTPVNNLYNVTAPVSDCRRVTCRSPTRTNCWFPPERWAISSVPARPWAFRSPPNSE